MLRKITAIVFGLIFLLISYPLLLIIYQNIFFIDFDLAAMISALSIFVLIGFYLLSINLEGKRNSKTSNEKEMEELKEEIQTYLESDNLEKLNVNTPVSLAYLLENTLQLNLFSPIIRKTVNWFLIQLAAYETTFIDDSEFESVIYTYQQFLEQY
ncbi:MAG: hypothetical protein ACXAC8_06365 [Candidatus Hodarchaeales archaeon]|jgi:hypothetical protein